MQMQALAERSDSHDRREEGLKTREFKAFLLRGNVVDLAVGIVIGAAFGALVTALVADLLTPLIAAIFGKPDFSTLSFTINGSTFTYGHFLNAVISFVLDRGGRLLLRGAADAGHGRTLPQGAAGRPHHQEVPRVPQRDPAGGAPVRLLHLGSRGLTPASTATRGGAPTAP